MMTDGIKVLITIKNDNGEAINELGFITRRINAHLYEIYSETSGILFILSPDEFKEINKPQDLYGIRNKIR